MAHPRHAIQGGASFPALALASIKAGWRLMLLSDSSRQAGNPFRGSA
ncbi:TPA: hypothetical protein PXN94_004162 [Yersinia enterocolitica]|nr:hypothetical protein [Yersinia enterocolitica]